MNKIVNKDFGWISTDAGVKKNIEVKMGKATLFDLFIGCGMIGIGVAYLVHNSFYRGANEFMDSEYRVLSDLDILNN